MAPRRRLGPLAIALLSTTFGGCSFAFVDGPPANHRTSPFFSCTSSNSLPVLDSVAATIALLDALSWGTGVAADSNGFAGSRTSNTIGFAAGAVLLGASAAYGFKKTSECRDAEGELVRRTPVAPAFTAGPFAPASYDPWVAHPPAPPVVREAPAPQAPAAPATSSGPGSAARDEETPGK
ncbi:MAG TPA: hypothetical protein VLC06_24015 [Polyangia bacterium]|nr:hypothetical protein [Polyangia bacterium]